MVKTVKTFNVYLIRSNVMGKIREAYTKKQTARKKKKLLEHIETVEVRDE